MAANEIAGGCTTIYTPRRAGRLAPLLLVLIASLFIGACETAAPTPAGMQRVIIKDKPFILELAVTSEQRQQGLSDRTSIPDDGGMLFVFSRPQKLSFVMRRCLVPIDLLYLDAGGRIVDMHEMKLEPYDTPEADLKRYSSAWPAQFVIELKDGTIGKLELELGEKVQMPVDALKTLAE
jgi:uncharacterized membrane protein (UPF0127 family)